MAELVIQHIAHDFDDTFFLTSRHFHDRIAGTAEYLDYFLHLGQEDLRHKVLGAILVAKSKHAVHPGMILNSVTDSFNAEYPTLHKEVRRAMRILKTAWKDVPELFPGTQEYLRFVTMEKLLLTVSTNAFPTWTRHKIARINQEDGLIDPRNVFCVPVTRRKERSDWERLIKIGGFPVIQVAGMGDDKEADINSMNEAGIQDLILVDVGYPNVNRGKVIKPGIKYETVTDHRQSIEIVKRWRRAT